MFSGVVFLFSFIHFHKYFMHLMWYIKHVWMHGILSIVLNDHVCGDVMWVVWCDVLGDGDAGEGDQSPHSQHLGHSQGSCAGELKK